MWVCCRILSPGRLQAWPGPNFLLVGIIVAMLGRGTGGWALITFAVLPLMIWLTNYWRVRVRDAYRATRQRLSLINGYLNESITGIRITKSFTRVSVNFGHFNDLNLSYFDANVQAARLTAIFFPGVDMIGSLATALVVGVGGWLVLGNALTAGALVAFVLYVDRFFDPIRELAQRYNTFQAAMAASERIFGSSIFRPIWSIACARPLPHIAGRADFRTRFFQLQRWRTRTPRHFLARRARPAHRSGRRDRRWQDHDHWAAGPLLRR